MFNKFVQFLVVFCLLAFVYTFAQKTDKIGKWYVEIGPPGNEFYHSSKTNIPPPSEKILKYIRIFVPHIQVTKWDMDNDNYDIRCEEGFEEYRFEITPQGRFN